MISHNMRHLHLSHMSTVLVYTNTSSRLTNIYDINSSAANGGLYAMGRSLI